MNLLLLSSDDQLSYLEDDRGMGAPCVVRITTPSKQRTRVFALKEIDSAGTDKPVAYYEETKE